MAKQWMIYGANGYTGRLIAAEAKSRGLSPVLAGRSQSVRTLGEKLGLPTRIFPLDTPENIARQLDGMTAVLHCAGPFSATSRVMTEACIRAKTHYFDITGEIDVFEDIHNRNAEFKAAGITAIPGVGFDVVPTDCVAAMLKQRMSDATHLRLAFRADGGPSVGTAKSAIEGFSKGGRVRQNGVLKRVPTAHKTMNIVYNERPVPSVSIPWGDVSTAFYSTGIPNIEVFMASPRRMAVVSKIMHALVRIPGVETTLKKLVEKTLKEPGADVMKTGKCWVVGEVWNNAGQSTQIRVQTPMGYLLTADSAVSAITKALDEGVQPGATTPSMAFGPEFLLSLKGIKFL